MFCPIGAATLLLSLTSEVVVSTDSINIRVVLMLNCRSAQFRIFQRMKQRFEKQKLLTKVSAARLLCNAKKQKAR
jgi:hypothetical protein